MKLKNEIENVKSEILKLTNGNIDTLKKYKESLKLNNNFKDFNTGFAWTLFNATNIDVTELYEVYNCNDNHIDTLIKRVLKDLELLD